eukprot:117574_1
MSNSTTFVKLQCARKFNYYMPKPSYCPKNKDVAIVSTTDKGIYEYNLQKNTFNKIHTYDPTFKPYNHGQFIDAKSELLYIFGCGQGIFDLNTKEMHTNTKHALHDCGIYPQSTYIPSP